jgi:hypothetical protein
MSAIIAGDYFVRVPRSQSAPECIEVYSTHYFNADGLEVGMQHAAFPDHCMIFIPPRVWDDSFKATLRLRTL